MSDNLSSDSYSEAEMQARADATLKRMLATPPTPHKPVKPTKPSPDGRTNERS